MRPPPARGRSRRPTPRDPGALAEPCSNCTGGRGLGSKTHRHILEKYLLSTVLSRASIQLLIVSDGSMMLFSAFLPLPRALLSTVATKRIAGAGSAFTVSYAPYSRGRQSSLSDRVSPSTTSRETPWTPETAGDIALPHANPWIMGSARAAQCSKLALQSKMTVEKCLVHRSYCTACSSFVFCLLFQSDFEGF